MPDSFDTSQRQRALERQPQEERATEEATRAARATRVRDATPLALASDPLVHPKPGKLQRICSRGECSRPAAPPRGARGLRPPELRLGLFPVCSPGCRDPGSEGGQRRLGVCVAGEVSPKTPGAWRKTHAERPLPGRGEHWGASGRWVWEEARG